MPDKVDNNAKKAHAPAATTEYQQSQRFAPEQEAYAQSAGNVYPTDQVMTESFLRVPESSAPVPTQTGAQFFNALLAPGVVPSACPHFLCFNSTPLLATPAQLLNNAV